MSASIRFNGVPTPLQVTTGTPVTLTNADDSEVAGWDWTILYKPPTSVATISNALTASASITPDVPGTYLIRLRTWANASRTILDGVALGATFIRFASAPTWRIPAVQETTEVNATEGWGNELNDILDYIQANIGSGGGGGAGSQGLTAYVDSLVGNDSTGEVENPNKPFLTIDAAMARSPTPMTLVLGAGDYTTNGITFPNSVPEPQAIRARSGKVRIEQNSGVGSSLVEVSNGAALDIEGDILLKASGADPVYAVNLLAAGDVYLSGVRIEPGGLGTVTGNCGAWREFNCDIDGPAGASVNCNGALISGGKGARQINDVGFNPVGVLSGEFPTLDIPGPFAVAKGVVVDSFTSAAGTGNFHGIARVLAQFNAQSDISGAELANANISGSGALNCTGTKFYAPPTIGPGVTPTNLERVFMEVATGTYSLSPTTGQVVADNTSAVVQIQLPDPASFFGAVNVASMAPMDGILGFSIELLPFGAELIDGASGTYTITSPTRGGFVLISDNVNWYFAATRGF